MADIEKNEKYADKKKSNGESRINAWISTKNYDFVDEILLKGEFKSLKKTKGTILDLALTNLFISLEAGESLDMIAINHLERLNK